MEYKVNLSGTYEKAMFDLRALYEQYGYTQYRVSKFEEYDLYAQNRSFITGSSILTFTDTDGRLMALKPDITLSIIKNTKLSPSVAKVYYNESVYRASDSASGFREIQQTGLECIGPLDLYDLCEIVALAEKSLAAISGDYILDVSHMGLLSGFLEDVGAPAACREQLLRLAEEKNSHEADAVCQENGISSTDAATFKKLIHLREGIGGAVKALSALQLGPAASAAVRELSEISSVLSGCGIADKIYLDLSLQCDPSYYNGLVFKGFINGIPSAILSGGRYDGLMKKLGKDTGAMGFALYLNLLKRWGAAAQDYDVDVLLLADGDAAAQDIFSAASKLISGGESVRVDRHIPDGLKYRRLERIGKEGI
ncbi:MAG: ATP phosphoribosyltransferase regulatory subunit [Oscillospiraceae bacterium]